MADATSKPTITLYTAQTPNGIKISMTLEELGLPYEVRKVDFGKKEQKEPWFLEVNPNGRIPALTDTWNGTETIRLFESGSIMQYLVDKYDTQHKISYPRGTREYYEMNSWLFFMNAGVGPMQGQANHFHRYAPEKIQYGVDRYINETRRLYRVLDTHLEKSSSGWLVGDKCTIADISHWGWVAGSWWAGVELDEFPHLKAWEERMFKRPATEKGRHVPETHRMRDKISAEQAQKDAAHAVKWILDGQKEDAKK